MKTMKNIKTIELKKGFRNSIKTKGFRNSIKNKGFRNSIKTKGFRNSIKTMELKKGFRLGDISSIVMTIGLTGIIIGIVLTVLSNVQDTQTTNSSAYNATNTAIKAVGQAPTWLSTIVVVGMAGVVIGILVIAFGYFSSRK